MYYSIEPKRKKPEREYKPEKKKRKEDYSKQRERKRTYE